MLEIVKDYINSMSDESFSSYFAQYVMQVQDANIESELDYLLHRNTLNVTMMDNIIQQTHRGLMRICSVT